MLRRLAARALGVYGGSRANHGALQRGLTEHELIAKYNLNHKEPDYSDLCMLFDDARSCSMMLIGGWQRQTRNTDNCFESTRRSPMSTRLLG
jgi:hypothetical protein